MDKLTFEERFWAKVDTTGECWLWTGVKDKAGYGRFREGSTMVLAHRLSYELEFFSIPKDMEIDHLCHNPGCVNPDHLRPATRRQNAENRKGPTRQNSSSGVRNVYGKDGQWKVYVGSGGQRLYFGTFPTIAEAEAVAIRARANLFDVPEIATS